MENSVKLSELRKIIDNMTLEEKASLISGDGFWKTDAIDRLGVRSVTMTDGPHGLRREKPTDGIGVMGESYSATCFPTAALLACSFDRDLMREVGAAIAEEAIDQGVSIVLGPGVNIKRSPLCGRNFEYFSEDPYCAGELAGAMIQGIQSRGVGACIKHYAANNQENKRFVADSCVDRRALHEIYLEAFRIAIKNVSPSAVMTSYNKTNGEYTGESEYMIRDVLRNRFGFSGAVMSDWGAVNDRVKGVHAGLDLEMPGKTSGNTDAIISAIKSGRLGEFELDSCALRVLELSEKTAAEKTEAADYEKNSSLARRAATRSAVLLKNSDKFLPLNLNEKCAVIGEFARNARYQGAGSSRINPTETVSALDALKAQNANFVFAAGYNADGTTDDDLIAEAKEVAQSADSAVIYCGLPEVYESEGYDREHMNLPDGMLRLIDEVCAVCGNIAVVLMLGSPVVLPFIDRVKSVLLMYTAGQCAGAASVDLIDGKVCPSGNLAETWAKKYSHVPCHNYISENKNCEYREGIYVGYRYYESAGAEPLFKFAHGLSYTEFKIDCFSCSKDELVDSDELTVSWRIRNIGEVRGAKTVFVFISKKNDPTKQLKGFEKAELDANQVLEQEVTLKTRDFAYFNIESDDWKNEEGIYTVSVGTSLDDIADSIDIKLSPMCGVPCPEYISPQSANDTDDDLFYHVLGYEPAEPKMLPYTMNSTLNELRHKQIGRIVYSLYKKSVSPDGGADECTAALLERSVGDMPIRALCAMSKGILPNNMARAIICFANGKPIRGIKYVFKK
ncbi:MAG: glycoside hydrolase family 3 C-terminal domain-containing protein [Oscillospiraceae bacterium]